MSPVVVTRRVDSGESAPSRLRQHQGRLDFRAVFHLDGNMPADDQVTSLTGVGGAIAMTVSCFFMFQFFPFVCCWQRRTKAYRNGSASEIRSTPRLSLRGRTS
jgi:hypothetical protein